MAGSRKVDLTKPLNLVWFFMDISECGDNEKIIISGTDYEKTFWKLWHAAKDVVLTKELVVNHMKEGLELSFTRPEVDFKIAFPDGKVSKTAGGNWWFYFNLH